VDWVPSRPERPEGLIIVYDGGVLSDSEITEIVLSDGELASFAFVARDEVAGLVTPLLARRVASCLDAVAAGTVAALENGSPAGPVSSGKLEETASPGDGLGAPLSTLFMRSEPAHRAW